MTAAVDAPPQSPPSQAPKAAFWEDFIDIFYAPSAVFERRQDMDFWPPMLVMTLALGVLIYLTFPSVQPVYMGEMQRQIATNPQAAANAAATEKMMNISMAIQRFAGFFMFIFFFVFALFLWLAGKIMGSRQTFNAAVMVISYSSITIFLQKLAEGVQGLLLDTSKMQSHLSLDIGPARFINPAHSSALILGIATTLNVFTIWSMVLNVIGLSVTGKISRGAAAFAVFLLWAFGALFAIWGATKLVTPA